VFIAGNEFAIDRARSGFDRLAVASVPKRSACDGIDNGQCVLRACLANIHPEREKSVLARIVAEVEMIGLPPRVSTPKAAAVLLTVACVLIPVIASTQSRADAVSDCAQSQDPDRGIRGCTAVIERKPQAAAYINRGAAYNNKGDYDRAIADFAKAIALDPKAAIAYYNRGNAYNGKGDYDRAIADYTKAIALDPQDASAYFNRGLAYKHKGDLDHAIADYTKVIALDPDSVIAYNNRGVAFANKGEHNEAISDYTMAILLDPKHVSAYYARGVTYENIGDKDRAIADFRKVLSLDPNHEGSAEGLRRCCETRVSHSRRCLSRSPSRRLASTSRFRSASRIEATCGLSFTECRLV
jgi:tetratricopeptide (TPR) repeat protein